MPPDGLWSIGELAAHAGVTVKTVRFYSDRGLLPEAGRSAGGHRRYGPGALDRLRLIRSLRSLDLPVPDVGRLLDREDALADALEDAVAGRLRELGTQLSALRWREAALHALRDCTAAERADRLRLVGALSTPPSTAPMRRFWRRWLPPRLPAGLVGRILELSVPEPPGDPTPDQVLAFARLHAFTTGACPDDGRLRPADHWSGAGGRPAALYEGLGEAYDLAAGELLAGREPREGDALDCFVSAYALAYRTRDTPAFRSLLAGLLAAEPRADLYWQLAAQLWGPARPTPGAADDWLRTALSGPDAA
ncbi:MULTISPECIES: MerR family transcriptional regulator [unclassified Streptomyces]|uniref:helix-turn-helix domain-containing protein n=1 Tax=unclassified Streptomyces TaxID=2593676 RepID=UPI00382F8F9B